jgi:hypothetical protein
VAIGESNKAIALALGCTVSAVKSVKSRKRFIDPNRAWTAEELAIMLKMQAERKSIRAIAYALVRTDRAIYSCLSREQRKARKQETTEGL